MNELERLRSILNKVCNERDQLAAEIPNQQRAFEMMLAEVRAQRDQHRQAREAHFEALSQFRFVVAGLLGIDQHREDLPTDETMIAAIEAAWTERDQLAVEVDRLRARVHEAVDETQRRYAKMQSDYETLKALHREAMDRHNAEMASKGKPDGVEISSYGLATAAVIIGERNAALAQVAAMRPVVEAAEAWRDRQRTYDGLGHQTGGLSRVSETVDAYRASQKSTDDY